MGNKGCENVHIFLGIWKAKFSPSVGRMIREDHGIAPPADLQRLHKQAVVAKARAVTCRGGCGLCTHTARLRTLGGVVSFSLSPDI